MEIYNLDYSLYKMFNPTTGEFIVDDECDDNAKSLIAYWLDDSIDNPIVNNEIIKTAWEAFVKRYQEDNDESPYWEDLIKFLEEYDNPEWIGYEITSSGIACGTVSYTVVYIVEKDIIIEELNEDEMVRENDNDQQ